MPFLSEHPYITTGLNFVYVYQRLPEGPVFDGGEAQVLALQIRAAITEKLGFIATKDGQDIVILGGGIRTPTKWDISFVSLYEGPISSTQGINNQRFTFMAIWKL